MGASWQAFYAHLCAASIIRAMPETEIPPAMRGDLYYAGKENFMSKEPFETMPDVMDAKQIAEALQISKAGAYNLLNSPDFPTLRIGGRKLVMKNELVEWLKSHTNRKA